MNGPRFIKTIQNADEAVQTSMSQVSETKIYDRFRVAKGCFRFSQRVFSLDPRWMWHHFMIDPRSILMMSYNNIPRSILTNSQTVSKMLQIPPYNLRNLGRIRPRAEESKILATPKSCIPPKLLLPMLLQRVSAVLPQWHRQTF